MSSEVTITEVRTGRDRKDFLQLPWTIYKDNPYWVPPLLISHLGLVGFQKDVFYAKSRIQTFLARRNGKVVGRIGAIRNQEHLDRYHDDRGFFGFFECLDDQEAANALFGAARTWLADQGLLKIRGPMNPSQNHEWGTLIEGFDRSPAFMMPYNLPYYGKLIEGYGFQKAQDMYAYGGYIEMLPRILGKYQEFGRAVCERFQVRIRPMDAKNLDREIYLFMDIMNRSFYDMWGNVPMSHEELEEIVKALRQLIVPELVVVAEVDGKVVGVIIGLPDYNPRIRAIKGKLFPFGWMKLLWNKRSIKEIRVISVNVLPEYQMMGIPLVMLDAFVPVAIKWGLKKAEFSWVLESNDYSRGSLEKAGTIREKTYRVDDFNG